ncbi:MAG: rod shape-determining protein MreC [Cyclobacteriaceae bacterium]|jgi:rod shape-determining protein MreC
MQNLLNFLYRFRAFGFFLVLEAFCVWLILSYNQRQNASFLNSSNAAIARVNYLTNNTNRFINLSDVNQQLLAENQFLRSELARINRTIDRADSSLNKYEYVAAKVINNTYERSLNYFTLDVGYQDGVAPGMGVISDKGVIGQIKSVSDHFATVTSLLHRNLLVSSVVKSSNTLCTVQWDGESPAEAAIRYIPRHIALYEGDSVVTSGYNSVFEPNIVIGTISKFNLNNDDAFYDAKIKLVVDFTSLKYAYVIKSMLKDEKDSLELEIKGAK